MKVKYYLGITFVLSWGIELALILFGNNSAFFGLMLPLAFIAPALAVFITKYVIKEPLWMNFWLKPEGRKTIRYSLFAWLVPFVLCLIGTACYFLLFSDNFDWNMTTQISAMRKDSTMAEQLKELSNQEIRSKLFIGILINLLMAPLGNMLTSVGEEMGWRGYFLNMLCDKYSKWRAVLISGVVWGIWYFPLVIGMGLFYGKDYTGYPVIGCICVIVYCVVLGTLYSYLTIKTHSCIPAILANASVNAMSVIGELFLKDTKHINNFFNYTPASVVGGIGFILVAAVLFYFFVKGKVEPESIKVEVFTDKDKTKIQTAGSMKQKMQNEHLRRNR